MADRIYIGREMLWRWAREATGRIRFSPDRMRVYDELMAHMEDAMEEHVHAGAEEKEAAARAVAAMGSAAEVAERMARLYRPFWGYAWKLTRVPAVLAGVYLVFMLTFGGLLRSGVFDFYSPDPYIERERAYSRLVCDLAPQARSRVGGYTVSVPRLRLWETEGMEAEGAEYAKYNGDRNAVFVLKMSSLNPWLAAPMYYRYVYATDDLGNVYGWRDYEGGTDTPETCGNLAHAGLFSSYAELWVTDIDPKATVLTIRYDGFGQQFALEIPLEVTEDA